MSIPTGSLSEATAIRLFNSVVTGNGAQEPMLTAQQQQQQQQQLPDHIDNNEQPTTSRACALQQNNGNSARLKPITNRQQYSMESIVSANEFGKSCRICRWNRNDMTIIKCPCKCRGSVGFIHLKCLKRWIMYRRDNRCEICHATFELTQERRNFRQMLKTFWCARCVGLILKHLMCGASLVPLGYVIMQQVVHCMDNLNQGTTDQLNVQEVFVASCALLTSSALFFHFFEFVTTRCILIRNVVSHWWLFGSTSDYTLLDIDEEPLDLF